MEPTSTAAAQREAEWRERRTRRQGKQQQQQGSGSAGGGGVGSNGGSTNSSTSTSKQFASSARWQRAQWALVMCFPCITLFSLRLLSKEGSLKSFPLLDNWLALPGDASAIPTAMSSTSYAICALLFSIAVALNELKGSSPAPTYFFVFMCALSWGSCIDLLEDLVLARLCCMAVFGVSAGQLWFLWDRHVAKKKLHYQRLERKRADRAMMAASSSVNNVTDYTDIDGHNIASSQSDDGGTTNAQGNSSGGEVNNSNIENNLNSVDVSEVEAPHPISPLWKTMQPEPLSGHEIAYWIWGKMGLAALWSLGEVLGCVMFVNHSYQFIGSSLLGYPLLVIFPILCGRAAMGLSWVLTLLIGNTHAYSARILRALHVVFTVLVFVTVIGGFVMVVRHYVPWVWSLQKLVGPYCLVVENLSYNSRKYHSKNPYQGFVDQHRERIAHLFVKVKK